MKMDICQNVSLVSADRKQDNLLNSSCSNLSSSLDDLFSAQNMEVDVEMEWLSVFVEDCFSSPQSCILLPSNVQNTTTTTTTTTTTISSKPSNTKKKPNQQQNKTSPLQNFTVPGKARSKRKRLSAPKTKKTHLTIWSNTLNPQNDPLISDPPLLKQTYWLADSELMVPKIEKNVTINHEKVVEKRELFDEKNNDDGVKNGENNSIATRRCSHCLSQRTPQWRAGPLGPKTLCNACGVRYKSGRLLPEYRPAKSPTFVSYLHSNSHKKVMEMRMSTNE